MATATNQYGSPINTTNAVVDPTLAEKRKEFEKYYYGGDINKWRSSTYSTNWTTAQKEAQIEKLWGDVAAGKNVYGYGSTKAAPSANINNYLTTVLTPEKIKSDTELNSAKINNPAWMFAERARADYVTGKDITTSAEFQKMSPKQQAAAIGMLNSFGQNDLNWNMRVFKPSYNRAAQGGSGLALTYAQQYTQGKVQEMEQRQRDQAAANGTPYLGGVFVKEPLNVGAKPGADPNKIYNAVGQDLYRRDNPNAQFDSTGKLITSAPAATDPNAPPTQNNTNASMGDPNKIWDAVGQDLYRRDNPNAQFDQSGHLISNTTPGATPATGGKETAQQLFERIKRGEIKPDPNSPQWNEMYVNGQATQVQKDAYALWDAYNKATTQGDYPVSGVDNTPGTAGGDGTIAPGGADANGVPLFKSAQELANYVLANGITDLQSKPWWSSSPFKLDAWGIIDAANKAGAGTDTTVITPPVYNVGGEELTPENYMQTIMDSFKLNQASYEASYATITDDYASKASKIQEAITKREAQLNEAIASEEDNPWNSQTQLDRQKTLLKQRAAIDIGVLTSEYDSLTAGYKTSTEALDKKFEQGRTAINDFINAAEKVASIQDKEASRENQKRDDARAAISDLVDNLGVGALRLVDANTFAQAGYSNVDIAALDAAITKKEREELMKDNKSEFGQWITAYNNGDYATMKAIENFMTIGKNSGSGNSISSGSWLLEGKPIVAGDVAGDNATLGEDILSNCVKYARTYVPDLPYGLFTLQDKMAVANSRTAVPGAVAFFDVGTEAGHATVVMQTDVAKGKMLIREANYGGTFAQERWVPITSAVGFYVSGSLQNKGSGDFPNIDSKFDQYYAQYLAGKRTKESIMADLTVDISDKGQVKQIRDYVNQKWMESDFKFSKIDLSGVNKYLGLFGLSLPVDSVSIPNGELEDRYPVMGTDRRLSATQIIQLQSNGLWDDSYRNMDVTQLPKNVIDLLSALSSGL